MKWLVQGQPTAGESQTRNKQLKKANQPLNSDEPSPRNLFFRGETKKATGTRFQEHGKEPTPAPWLPTLVHASPELNTEGNGPERGASTHHAPQTHCRAGPRAWRAPSSLRP